MIKAGFSRVDITPPLGSYVSGYFEDRYAKGIMDPLYLNAIAISDGDDTAIIITADLIGIGVEHCTPIREKIAECVGISADNVIINALHQHTAVCVRRFTNDKNDLIFDSGYVDILYRKFADVSKMAYDDMSEATLGVAEMEALEQLAFIRRFYMKDGSVKTHASKDPNMVRPAGDPDNTVRLLKFVREGKNDIALINFSTHPDTVKGELFSADWPGHARNYIEADHEGVSCLLINGAEGDSNHNNYVTGSRGPGGVHAKYMGRVIADTVKVIWDKTKAEEDIKVSGSVDFVYQLTRTDGIEYHDECVEKLPLVIAKELPPEVLDHVGGKGGASRISRLYSAPLFQKVPVSVVSLGKICFVGFGGEPFMHYATAVREAFPEKYIIALCCANGYEGYLPTTSALSEGGYEASASPFQQTLEEDCVNLAVKIIGKLDSEE